MKAAVGFVTIKAMRGKRTREIRKSKVQCYYYGQGCTTFIYSDGSHVTTTTTTITTIYVYSCCYTTTAAAAFPADDALGRIDNDNGAFRTMMVHPLVPTLSVVISSHSPYIRFAIFRRNSVTDYAATTNTADKVLPSSLVSDRVNAVYSFISANPFDNYVFRWLIIVCACLPVSLPHHTIRRLFICCKTIQSAGYYTHSSAPQRRLGTISEDKRSDTANPAKVRISIPSRTLLVYF